MKAYSRDWLWLSLLLIFEAGHSIEYGLGKSIVVFLGFISGIALVLIVGYLLSKLDEDKIYYEDKYHTLGVTITYEYLFGKKGTARQLWAVFTLVLLPVSILTTYLYPVSSRQFWLFVIPMGVISTGIAYCWLNKLFKTQQRK